MIMSHSFQQPRRSSVSIYEYPEDLNPFKDEELDQVELRKPFIPVNCATSTSKEHKQKFWTFGKSRKKRPNSFSIKSTWNGIFGRRKDCDRSEGKPTIATVSSTYRNTSCVPETVVSRLSSDQQEFDQALSTLARRRKYTLDNSSRYSSSLTVNGDSRRIYDGCPQETTASIMGDLTPKAPVRRFGQVSPKFTDELPPLNYYDDCRSKDIEGDNCDMPIPPKRSGVRSSQRLHATLDTDEHNSPVKSDTMIDENENMTEDYVFKRYNRNPLQKSNLSINSCLSMASVYHSGRKKRRAPPPPIDKNSTQLLRESKTESDIHTDSDLIDNRDNLESINIVKSAEDIKDEMTKRNQSLDGDSSSSMLNNSSISLVKMENNKDDSSSTTNFDNNSNDDNNEVIMISKTVDNDIIEDTTSNSSITVENDDIPLKVELKKEINQCVEIVNDVNLIENKDNESVTLLKKESLGNVSSESFCVKQEIEKIERQIKLLETNKIRSRTSSLCYNNDENFGNSTLLERSASRRSLQENRRNFFRDLTGTNKDDQVKIQLKEFPRQQNDIKIVRLSESQVTNATTTINVTPEKPVKVIELHISEPIKQRPEFTVTETDINPIPKPRRQNALPRDNNQLDTNDSYINKDKDNEICTDSL